MTIREVICKVQVSVFEPCQISQLFLNDAYPVNLERQHDNANIGRNPVSATFQRASITSAGTPGKKQGGRLDSRRGTRMAAI
jgi:hypothetical protein